MKILLIPNTDWVGAPRGSRLNFIFDKLAENNDVYVAHFRYKKFRDNKPLDTKCKLCDMGGRNITDFSLYYTFSVPEHMSRLREIIRKENIEIIVSANIMPSFLANFVKKQAPIVVDYLDHFDESAAIYYRNSMLKRTAVKSVADQIVKRNLRRADNIIVVSPFDIGYLRKRYQLRQEIFVVPNGVDTSAMKPMEKEQAKKALGLSNQTVIGFTGLLEYWIDLEDVIQQLPKIIEKIGAVKLLIVGASLYSDYTDNLKKLAKELNVENSIIFAGLVPYTEVPKYVSAMDVCLNPRKNLAMNAGAISNKLLGYLACGRPVLSRNDGAAEEAFEHVYPYSDGELADKLCGLLKTRIDEDAVRKEALNYDWDILAKQYEQILLKVVGK